MVILACHWSRGLRGRSSHLLLLPKCPVFSFSTVALGRDGTTNKQFVYGGWIEPNNSDKSKWIRVLNPATEEVIALVPPGDAIDVDRAVQAARAAFPSWSEMSGKERAPFMRRVAEIIGRKKEELAQLETLDSGKPLSESKWDVDAVVSCFQHFAALAEVLDS
mmetsp:Transcript_3714/g.5960  ORF Transcript_3714/g.5960 Transcript_3714/m.5960 type:complete len:163 (-) Transcript_3714:12-500(-)